MSLQVLNDNVLVVLDAAEEKSAGGIIFAESARKSPNTGVVSAVGNGRVLKDGVIVPLAVTVGDRVMLQQGSGVEVTVEGTKYVVIKEDEILGVIS